MGLYSFLNSSDITSPSNSATEEPKEIIPITAPIAENKSQAPPINTVTAVPRIK